jgi:hypothetical protein
VERGTNRSLAALPLAANGTRHYSSLPPAQFADALGKNRCRDRQPASLLWRLVLPSNMKSDACSALGSPKPTSVTLLLASNAILVSVPKLVIIIWTRLWMP